MFSPINLSPSVFSSWERSAPQPESTPRATEPRSERSSNVMQHPHRDLEPGYVAQSRALSMAFDEQQSVSFNLRTRDGDLVTLELFHQQSGALEYSQQQFSTDRVSLSQEAFSMGTSRSSELMFRVEGELDADELSAINDMLEQINLAAGEFFQGDPLQAFESLQRLDYDSSEIASYSLEMNRQSSLMVSYEEQAVAAYRDVGERDGHHRGEHDNGNRSLARYVQGLMGALNAGSLFEDSDKAVNELLLERLQPLFGDRFRDSVDDSADRQLDAVGAMNLALLDALNGEEA